MDLIDDDNDVTNLIINQGVQETDNTDQKESSKSNISSLQEYKSVVVDAPIEISDVGNPEVLTSSVETRSESERLAPVASEIPIKEKEADLSSLLIGIGFLCAIIILTFSCYYKYQVS